MKVLIIGNGIAGYRAAVAIRHANKGTQLTMVTRENDALYSPCVLPYYLSGRIRREQTFVRCWEDYQRLGIETEFGSEVVEIDTAGKRVLRDNDAPLTYDKLILATGSHAVKVDYPQQGIFYIKTLADADALRRHRGKNAVVVGAGNIGIEIAMALKLRGYRVAVLVRSTIMRRSFDPEMERKVKDILEENGIRVLAGERPVKALGGKKIRGVQTDRREIDCDTLVWAVGVRPNVVLAQQAGIALGETGGIKVNTHMETSVPGVFACGDCVETRDIVSGCGALNLFWHNANRQGALAGANCLGAGRVYSGSENMLSTRVFGAHVAAFGFTASALTCGAGNPWAADDISVVTREKQDSYSHLVLCGDRCVGAQFINPCGSTGLIRSMICRKRSVRDIRNACIGVQGVRHRPWLYPVKSFFN